MDTVHMIDIIPLLPVPHPPNGRSSYYMPCPRCDRGDRKKDRHLNINLAKDVFCCPKCGWNGGIFDFYAFYTNTPRNEVRGKLMRILHGQADRVKPASIPAPPRYETVESPIADIDTRHAVYTTLLSMLTLAPEHKQNLLARGLTERAITENGYRTTPVIGEKTLARQLLASGQLLAGVPGFFTDINREWSFVFNKRGIFVPVRDIQGRIQGLQIRLDNIEKRKYRWLSSSDSKDGCGAEGWVHLAGSASDSILLIEGPMKADIVHCLTGLPVLAVPGVNSLKYLESALSDLMKLGVRRIMTAFDMDFLRNWHVQDGYTELVNLISRMGLCYGTYVWRPDLNGLDDYIWECNERGHTPGCPTI